MSKLPERYYRADNVVGIAQDLLGKYLFTNIGNVITGGVISETEAYAGEIDKGSHAYGGKRTRRTEIMYQSGGVSYVYLCYGVHHLFNVVTNVENIPHAILVRGIVPTIGTDLMLSRTKKRKVDYSISNGPGKLTKALGIDIDHNQLSLQENEIWIEDKGVCFSEADIHTTPRIGIDYAEEDALLPYRFVLKDFVINYLL